MMHQNLLYPKQHEISFCLRKVTVEGNQKENTTSVGLEARFICLKSSRRVIFSTK